jgi:hypothetical protein
VTEMCLPKRGKSNEDRRKFDGQLNEWYWEDGGAMFLSWTASRRLMEARNRLRCIVHKIDGEIDRKKETKDIKDAFSDLRTELKYDCGVISSEEKPINIGNLQDWQLDTDEKNHSLIHILLAYRRKLLSSRVRGRGILRNS